MDINLKVKIEAPGIMAALLAIADGVGGMRTMAAACGEKKPQKDMPEAEAELKKEESKGTGTEEVKGAGRDHNGGTDEVVNESDSTVGSAAVTIEEVRAKLAALSEGGKRKQVRELLKKFGAGKLTDVAPYCYGELLKEAGEL